MLLRLLLSLAAPGRPGGSVAVALALVGMVLGPSVARYGTRAASILYYALVRLDNLGRCVDVARDAGDRVVSPSRCFITGRRLLALQTRLYYRQRR